MQICQNPNCPNPFNPDGNRFCIYCGANNLGALFRNRFRVMRLLGEGGFSKTYVAEDVDRLDDPCVIKQFVPQVQGTAALNKAAELFKQEARRLFELGEHSQIPRLISYFEQGNRLYLVQEFIQGQTLLQELQKGAFTETQILQVLTDLLPVLQFIHQRNVIHRDIKPENIIRRQTDGKLVLIDFGGAKQVTQTNLAKAATGIYTPGYAPTEQMAGRPCHASDLYSLGATCARLLTQCLPIPDEYGDLNDNLYDAHEGRWLWREHLQKKGVTFSKQLGEVLDKLLEHLPKDRFQSAEEVLKFLNSPPSSVPSQTAPKQSGKLKVFEFDVVTVDSQGRIKTKERREAEFFAEDLGNGVILEMVLIPGGTFIMGSPYGEGSVSEQPEHEVTIAPFCMGKFPVTQAQWKTVASLPQIICKLDSAPSHFKGENRPVECVTWYEAVEFCARLSKKTGQNYRLPSEAEWEYACRSGTTTPFHFGETITPELANYNSNHIYNLGPKGKFHQETTVVGSFQVANGFGLYDMHGNVWEWCADPWHDRYDRYSGAPSDGKVWEFRGKERFRLIRGGTWNAIPEYCLSAFREYNYAAGKNFNIGFRVACSLASTP